MISANALKNNYKGFAQIILILLILAGIITASAVSYYILKARGEAPKMNTIPTTFVQPTANPSGLSNSTDINTIQTELDGTTLDSVDADLNSLNTSAGAI